MATPLGLDYAWSRPRPVQAWAAGYRFVSRYLSWLPNGKVINKAELDALRKQGFTVMLNWEYSAGDMKGGANYGKIQATEAVKQAKALGAPAGTALYFSCDWDATAAQLSGVVRAYMAAARAVTSAAGYRIGIYGGYDTVKYALDNKLVDAAWQTYAWSGGKWDARAAVRQVKNGINVDGADCDRNELHGNAYMVGDVAPKPPAKPPVKPPAKPPVKPKPPAKPSNGLPPYTNGRRTLKLTSPQMKGTDVLALQHFIGAAQCGKADGVFGAKTKAGVIWYQRMRGLSPDGEVGPKTWAPILKAL